MATQSGKLAARRSRAGRPRARSWQVRRALAGSSRRQRVWTAATSPLRGGARTRSTSVTGSRVPALPGRVLRTRARSRCCSHLINSYSATAPAPSRDADRVEYDTAPRRPGGRRARCGASAGSRRRRQPGFVYPDCPSLEIEQETEPGPAFAGNEYTARACQVPSSLPRRHEHSKRASSCAAVRDGGSPAHFARSSSQVTPPW